MILKMLHRQPGTNGRSATLAKAGARLAVRGRPREEGSSDGEASDREERLPRGDVAAEVVPLTGFAEGARVEIACLGLEDQSAQRLRDLGLREGARCLVLMNNGKLIVSVEGSRIGLRKELAMRVYCHEVSG